VRATKLKNDAVSRQDAVQYRVEMGKIAMSLWQYMKKSTLNSSNFKKIVIREKEKKKQ